MTETRSVDVAVVGAGFAGMYLLHRARGLGLTVEVVEAADDVGGTWFWNRYPGARCDVESMEYSYSFDEDLQQEWTWSERYAGQPEILRYARHVADRFGLRSSIRFGTRVTGARYDENRGRWAVATDRGHHLDAQFLVLATGCLSSALIPAIEGAESFTGEVVHTGRWPAEGVDVTGKRVGVIGTGSSGIQAIPVLAAEAEVKATYASFRAANLETSSAFGSRVAKLDRSALEDSEAEREAQYRERWERGGFTFLMSYNDLFLDAEANDTAAAFVRRRIRETVVDPQVAARLTPDQAIGCKRLCIDSGYYEAFNRPNVDLVDLRESPIEAITPAGLRTTAGEHHLDVLVYATGFDAMTGSILRIDVRGRDGVTLRDAWAAGPHNYLGLSVHGFPNLFTVTGPGSPSVLTNMIMSIEHHVVWITECIDHLRRHGLHTIEATADAQQDWVRFVNDVAALTIFPSCNSWYLGANVPGKERVFMPLPGFPLYTAACAEVVEAGYRGFALI